MNNERTYQLIAGIGFLFFGIQVIYDVTKKFTTINTFKEGNNYKLYVASFACLLIGISLVLGFVN